MLRYFPKVAASYKRPTGTYGTDGKWVAGSPASVPILVIAPQPATGRDLQMMPEGDRVYRHLKTWTETELMPNDMVTYDGTTYRVIPSANWAIEGNYHRVLLREMQQ